MEYSYKLKRISQARRAGEGHAVNKIKIFIAVFFCAIFTNDVPSYI